MPDTVDPDAVRLLLTPRQAAAALSISRSTLYVLMSRGQLRSVVIGASRRVSRSELDAFIGRLSAAASTASSQQSCEPCVSHGASLSISPLSSPPADLG